MPDKKIDELLKVDLASLTIADIGKITNPAVRLLLAELVSDAIRVRPEHTSHGKHTDHLKNAIQDSPIIDRPVVDDGGGQ